MRDLNFLKRFSRKSDSGEREIAKDGKARGPVTTILEPKPGLALGRRLAFSIGKSHLAMATVRHVGRSRCLIDLRGVDVPAELETRESRVGFISNALASYVAQFGGRSPQITVSVSGWETAFRSFVLPMLSKKEMAAAVGFEASKQLPFPAESCIYDHRPIAKVDSEGTSRYQISLQAATLRLINGLLEPFDNAGIPVSQINTGPEVMGELLKCLKTYRGDDSYTMVEVTPDRSITSFYQDGALVFSFVGSIGADSLPEHPTEFDLDTFAESLIDEIQVSQDYFGGQRSQSSTNEVFVYGSLKPSDAILKHLNGRSGLEFAWFPIEDLKLSAARLSETDETSLANLSALASAINGSRLANLLPNPHRVVIQERRRLRWAQAAAAVVAIALGLSYWGEHARHANAQANVTQIETELAKLKESEAYRGYCVIKRQIAADMAYLNQAQQSPSYVHLELKEFSRLSTPGIILDNLYYGIFNEEAPLMITGRASSTTIPPEVVLAEYVESLRASKLCDNVQVKRYLKRRTEDRFEIEFTIGLEPTIS